MDEETFTPSPEGMRPADWRWWITRLLTAGVGAVFLLAGVLKAMDMPFFIRQIRDYQIITDRTVVTLLAWGLIAVECAVGVSLLVFYRPRITLAITGLLLLVFLGATSWAWATGATEACGCFGAWAERTPAEAALEDLFLLAATGLAWLGYRRRRAAPSRRQTLAVTAACVIGLILPVAFGFPLSAISHPQSTSTGMTLGDLRVEGLAHTDVHRGTYLIVLIDTECSHCQEAVPELNALAEASDLPPVVALCKNEEWRRLLFIDEFQPAFPLGQISQKEFMRLLADGDTPRLMLVRDGRVDRVWDRTVPSPETIRKLIGR